MKEQQQSSLACHVANKTIYDAEINLSLEVLYSFDILQVIEFATGVDTSHAQL